MTRRWFLVAVPAAAIAIFVGKALSADPKYPAANPADVFDGKLLTISSKGESLFGAVLEKVSLRQLGGKTFLVGTSVDTGEGEDWTKGRTTWYPIDEAGQIIEFDNVEQLKRAHRVAAP